MKRFQQIFAAARIPAILFLLATLGGPQITFADSFGWRGVSGAAKKADKDWDEGKTEAALEKYQEILDGTEKGAEHRQSALMALASTALSQGDEEAATPWIEELETSFPNYRETETVLLRNILTERQEAKEKLAAQESELLELRTALGAAQEETGEADTQVQSCSEELTKAQREVRRLRGALAEQRDELQKKEEAIERLKAAIVGGR